jgi:hypothetical protein
LIGNQQGYWLLPLASRDQAAAPLPAHQRLIVTRDTTIIVRLRRRSYSPVLRQAGIPQMAVPWWGGRQLRPQFA